MGVLRDIIKTVDNTPAITEEIKEALATLMGLAEAKGEQFKAKIEKDLATGKTIDGLTIAIQKVIKSEVIYRAYTATGVADLPKKIADSLKVIFTGGDNILPGVADLCQTALTAIIGAGEGREGLQEVYTVVAEFPAINRYDFAFWSRNIQAKSIKTHVTNAITVVAYKSSVDATKLDFNTFLSVYGPVLNKAFNGDQTKIKERIMDAKEIFKLYKPGNAAVGFGMSDDDQIEADVQKALSSTRTLAMFSESEPTVGNF